KPVERAWLLDELARLTQGEAGTRVLVVDDDEVSRYLLRQSLRDSRYVVLEASSGHEALRRVQDDRPHVIFLDLIMPGVGGFEVLEHLKADRATRDIPVIVVTSKLLGAEERERLARQAVAILPKATPSREAASASIQGALARVGLTETPR